MKKQLLKRNISLLIMIVIYAFIMVKCANPVAPTGGPKDETPPFILSSEPENYSAHFSDRKMNIKFNEFIQIRDLQKQLLISPPMETKPEIKVKKKSVVIEFDEDEILKENTTYTIFLGNAIGDLTENNPYLNLEYVFSTGDFVDSLSIRGSIKNAFTGLPSENVSIMLYVDENDTIALDSMPLKIRPNYVAKTDKEGNFGIFNLRNVPYKMFALNDQNSNYIYDLPYEEIAFLDSIVYPYYTGKRQAIVVDSAALDTIPVIQYEYTPTELFLFTSIDSTQEISDDELLENYKLKIKLKFPCENFALNPLNFDSNLDWKIEEPNKDNDSILIWLRPNVPDTIQFEFLADGVILDTLDIPVKKAVKKFNNKSKGKGKKGKDKNDTVQITRIKPLSNLRNDIAELNQKLKIDFDYPLDQYVFASFIWKEDTTYSVPEIKFSDSSRRHLYINNEIIENVKYELIIPDSTLFNIYGNTNDSIVYSFSSKTKDQYGNLILTIEPEYTEDQWILQLMNDKGKVLKETIITKKEIVRFEYMAPGNYNLRAILDQNKNGYWDTGNYAHKRQAEKVIYLNSEIELRANWDYEENWNLK